MTLALASPTSRAGLLALGKSDPLIGDALQTIFERGELIGRNQASIGAVKRDIRMKSGSALLDFIRRTSRS